MGRWYKGSVYFKITDKNYNESLANIAQVLFEDSIYL